MWEILSDPEEENFAHYCEYCDKTKCEYCPEDEEE